MLTDRWPGDIFGSFPRGGGGGGGEQELSALIVSASQLGPDHPPSHIFVIKDAKTVVEMTAPAMRDVPWEHYQDGFILWHMRWQGLKDGERQAIADWMWDRRGMEYGYAGLLFDGLDHLFASQAISQALGFDKVLVCSAAAHKASKEAAGRGLRLAPGGKLLRPGSTTPAHWTAAAKAWPEDLALLEDTLTEEDKARAAASWAAKHDHLGQLAATAGAGWPPPGA